MDMNMVIQALLLGMGGIASTACSGTAQTIYPKSIAGYSLHLVGVLAFILLASPVVVGLKFF